MAARSAAVAVFALILARARLPSGAESPSGRRFTIQQRGQECWLVKPNGGRFFSLGVCCVSQGAAADAWDPANPSYAAWRHYNDSRRLGRRGVEPSQELGLHHGGGMERLPDLKTLR